MKAKNEKTRPVKVRRRLYPNFMALLGAVSMLESLGYTVKVV